jgi:hypothetical protein
MKNIVTTLILMLSTTVLGMAQNFSDPSAFTPDVLDNPIDGGLGILLGAGAAYGAKKLRDCRNNKNKPPKNLNS